jgi:hypothetical protein
MITDNGQVTIVASGSIASESLSLATIENPDEKLRREYIDLFCSVSAQGRAGQGRARATCLMMTWSTALQDENSLREKQATP